MSDTTEEPVEAEEPMDEPVEGEEEAARLIVPELDGEGGTKYVYAGTDEEASLEDWRAQEGLPEPEDTEAVDEEDDGEVEPEPDE